MGNNCKGHIYIGRICIDLNYIGSSHTGQIDGGHNGIGHRYVGHNYVGRNKIAGAQLFTNSAVIDDAAGVVSFIKKTDGFTSVFL